MRKKYINNSIRGPINSWVFNILSGYMHWLFGKYKRSLFKDHPDTIVEIGPGSGANMRYLRKGTNVVAIEPNIHMHSNLKKNANKYGVNLQIKTLEGEDIDLPSNSCEFVVSTLVLCTVSDPFQCINQIRRILKPSGEFIFMEHVRAKEGTILSWIQKLIHKPWHWFFEGCHTNRDTKALLVAAGFKSLSVKDYNLLSPFIPIIPQIRGKAIK